MDVYEVLSDDVIGTAAEILIRKSLNFQGEIEVAQVLKRNRRHTNLILFCWDFDHRSIFIRLVEILYALYLGYFAFRKDWQTQRSKILKLHLQKSLNDIIFLDWWYLNCNLDLGSFSLSNFESDLFKILKTFITPH